MKNKIIILSLLLLLSCISARKHTVLKSFKEGLDELGNKLAKGIPNGKVVIVTNILKDKEIDTYISVELAIKIGGILAEKGKGKFKVIDRKSGEKLWMEERKYTVKDWTSAELKKLFENFGANVGIFGDYKFFGNKIILDNIRAVAVPDPETPPEIITFYPYPIIIPLDSSLAKYFKEKDKPLPQPPDSITEYFLTAQTQKNFVSADIVDLKGEIIKNNTCKNGSYYRLKVNLKEDAYLYAFSYDEDKNQTYLIFPLNEEENRIIKQGVKFIPPGELAILATKEEKTAEKNFIKIFATKRPIPFSIPQSKDYHLTHDELKKFVKELKNLPPSDWSIQRIFVKIEE
jgi:hypothetical protein